MNIEKCFFCGQLRVLSSACPVHHVNTSTSCEYYSPSLFLKPSLNLHYLHYLEVDSIAYVSFNLVLKNPLSISPSDEFKLNKFEFSKLLCNAFRLHYVIRQRGLKHKEFHLFPVVNAGDSINPPLHCSH